MTPDVIPIDSRLTPERLRPEVEVEVERKSTTSAAAERSAVDAAAAVRAMGERGIDNAEAHLAFASPDAILGACRDWDGRRGAGPGLLSRMIRDGGKPGFKSRSTTVGQRTRGAEIRAGWTAWARDNLPEALYPDGSLHLGAHAALFRDGRPVDAVPGAQRKSLLSRGVTCWDKRFGVYEEDGE